MFSAIINRDQVYQFILDQGLLLGLSWGSDITLSTSRVRGSPSSRGTPSSDSQNVDVNELESI